LLQGCNQINMVAHYNYNKGFEDCASQTIDWFFSNSNDDERLTAPDMSSEKAARP
jgi:hypothetical protein